MVIIHQSSPAHVGVAKKKLCLALAFELVDLHTSSGALLGLVKLKSIMQKNRALEAHVTGLG